MAKIAGIILRPEQKEFYVDNRHVISSGKKEEKLPSSCYLPDQILLYQSLDEEEQKAAFKRKYPRIFDSENLANI